MKNNLILENEQELFVGIDLHNKNWHVTIRTYDQQLFSANIKPEWSVLKKHLDHFNNQNLNVVYEAGYFGYSLYNSLIKYGAKCIVTPPSLIPSEYGNRVKTDKKDSQKLAFLLSRGLLKSTHVPSKDHLYHRQLLRRRKQLVRDRTRIQSRIKGELKFYGKNLPDAPSGKWTKVYIAKLNNLQWKNSFMKECFQSLLNVYSYLKKEINKLDKLIKKLSQETEYKQKVKLLTTIPGVALLSAMEILTELPDIQRFNKANKLAAYVGLTPSQYSSSDKIRMGRITKAGKPFVRSTLVESSWVIVSKDPIMAQKYNQLKLRIGGKRAVVAIARRLLLAIRRMLLDQRPYRVTAFQKMA